MEWVVIFIFGAIVGSFLNVVVCRYNSGESVVKGGSRCFSCGKKLEWHELVPILSFILQKGRCSGCGSKISWQYPAVETITGLIFLSIFSQFSDFLILKMFYCWIVASLLMVIAVYDLKHQIIPNALVYSFAALAFLSPIIARSSLRFAVHDYAAGIIFFAFFALLWFVSGGKWMGFGDAKLALGIGWLLGPEKGFWTILFSFWIGAVVGIFLLIFFRKRYNIKSKIPFAPFLALAAIIALLFP